MFLKEELLIFYLPKFQKFVSPEIKDIKIYHSAKLFIKIILINLVQIQNNAKNEKKNQ